VACPLFCYEYIPFCSPSCVAVVCTGEVRPADMLGSEFPGSQRGEYYVITAL